MIPYYTDIEGFERTKSSKKELKKREQGRNLDRTKLKKKVFQ